ncbi:anti-sigma factor [Phaeovulum sp. W22_SRMD_FR3]|uniref:anti-sigma factor n=1 Tax=Phaeovulum sp. W22_SRMD_FR3 TaxID=3240274 RepID=UPI003F994907
MSDRPLMERIDEVVLGLASDAEQAEIAALCAADADLAAALERARQRFGALDDTADVLPLPEGLWGRVEQALEVSAAETVTPDALASDTVPAARILPFAARPTSSATGPRDGWRLAALGGMAASLLLAVSLGWSLMSGTRPTVVAVLLDDQGQPFALVEGAADNTTLVTLLEQARVPENQVMQVWTKPDAAGKPVSLGLLATARSRALSVEGLPPPHADQLYEITFEPAGGSPTQLPTGPILGKGFAKTPIY